ncbi:MAG TPA: hypothetical protein VFQ59_03580 [Candidatus Paceibacterota bacterium]|nr:hypothetical protein [Candidatus Paceibacterota bacterium]
MKFLLLILAGLTLLGAPSLAQGKIIHTSYGSLKDTYDRGERPFYSSTVRWKGSPVAVDEYDRLPVDAIVNMPVFTNGTTIDGWVLLPAGTMMGKKNGRWATLESCTNPTREVILLVDENLPNKNLMDLQTTIKGELKVTHSGEIRVIHSWEETTPAPKQTFQVCEDEGSWTAGKTVGVALGAVAGGLGAGFGFPKRETHTGYNIYPGDALQTANGTKIFGPPNVVPYHWEEKKFNPLAAATGALVGGGLTYFLLR